MGRETEYFIVHSLFIAYDYIHTYILESEMLHLYLDI